MEDIQLVVIEIVVLEIDILASWCPHSTVVVRAPVARWAHHLVIVPSDASLLVGGHAPAASIGPCLRHCRSTVRALLM